MRQRKSWPSRKSPGRRIVSAPDDERKEDRMMRRLEARAARDVEPSESDEVARLERLGDVGRLNLSDDEKEWFTSLEALPTRSEERRVGKETREQWALG